MAGNSVPKVFQLHHAKNLLKEEAQRYCGVLEQVKTPAALKMREQLHAQIQATDDAVDKAAATKQLLEEAKQLSAHTDSGFMAGLRGFVDLVEIGDEKLFARVPNVENLSKLDPDGYAANLAGSLRGAGKMGDALATFIEGAMAGRLKAKAELLKQETALADLNSGKASLSDIKGLIAVADSLIHKSVPVGSPLLKQLKKPAKPRAKKPAVLGPDGKPIKKTRGKKADGAKETASGTAAKDATPPASTPAHVEPPAPATPNVVAVPSVPAIPDGEPALALTVLKVNGASGPQLSNGVGHS